MEIAIGELSRRTKCNIETIRYYERIGLLPKARRESGGRFRRYDADDIARLRFRHVGRICYHGSLQRKLSP
jgi:MerR family mercuric resistance operon transcriptional regulator